MVKSFIINIRYNAELILAKITHNEDPVEEATLKVEMKGHKPFKITIADNGRWEGVNNSEVPADMVEVIGHEVESYHY